MRERNNGSALLARWRWVVLFAALGLGLAGVACSLTAPTYVADAQLYVFARGSANTTDLVNGSEFAQQGAQSYAKLATSEVVLAPVISDLGLRTTPQSLAEQITASAQLNTVLIDLQVHAARAGEAAAIANAVAAQLARAVADLDDSPTAQTATAPVSVNVVQPAAVPAAAASPDVAVYLALGLLAGLVLGIYVALLRDRLDSRLSSADDVRAVTDVPVIGEIEEAADLDAGLVVSTGTGADGFRRLRTNIRSLDFNQPRARSVFVTSALPGEGKTTTATNFALAVAETGSTVALVEADLRRPRLPTTAGLDQRMGLTDVLLGFTDLDSALQPWGDSGLTVLTSGRIPVNPGELLSSDAMSRLLADLGRRFDDVVIDSPPVLPFADSLVLGGLVGGTIFVVATGRVRRRQVERSLNALGAANVPLLGIVMNFVAPPRERRGGAGAFGRSARPSGRHPWRGWRAVTGPSPNDSGRWGRNPANPTGSWETFLPADDVAAAAGPRPPAVPEESPSGPMTARRWLRHRGWDVGLAVVVALALVAAFGAVAHVRDSASTASAAVVRVPMSSVPGAPLGVSVAPGSGALRVRWAAPATDGSSAVTGYAVEYADQTQPDASVSLRVGSDARSSTAVLVPGHRYRVTLTAINAVGAGPAAGGARLWTPYTLPAAPSAVEVTRTQLAATVSWTPPTVRGYTALTGNRITVTDRTALKVRYLFVGPVRATHITGLVPGHRYTFSVAAINPAGPSAGTRGVWLTVPPPLAVAASTFPSVVSVGLTAGDSRFALALNQRAGVTVSLVRGTVVVARTSLRAGSTSVARALRLPVGKLSLIGSGSWVVTDASGRVLARQAVVVKQSSRLTLSTSRSRGVVTVRGTATWSNLGQRRVSSWAGRLVEVQRLTAKGWVDVDSATTDGSGRVTARLRLPAGVQVRLLDTGTATGDGGGQPRDPLVSPRLRARGPMTAVDDQEAAGLRATELQRPSQHLVRSGARRAGKPAGWCVDAATAARRRCRSHNLSCGIWPRRIRNRRATNKLVTQRRNGVFEVGALCWASGIRPPAEARRTTFGVVDGPAEPGRALPASWAAYRYPVSTTTYGNRIS